MAGRGGIKWIWGPARTLLRKMPETTALLVLSVVTGILCGLAAVALKTIIHAIQHGLEALMPGSRWLYLVFPGVGMLLSMLIVRYIVRDNIGHGVTKVLQAVSKNESKIKAHNCWSSLLTSALTIGFGGSVGAEAPIVYTGAAIGSNLARYSGMSYRGMTLMLGCGAAGAVAGIFNAPLAGVLFTLEILLKDLGIDTLGGGSFSPDGRFFAGFGFFSGLEVVDLEKGVCIFSDDAIKGVGAVSLSGDGKLLLAACDEAGLCLFRTATRRC